MFIEVAIPVNLHQIYTYKVSPEMGEVEVGGVVYVNFNGRNTHAVVVRVNVEPNLDPQKIKLVNHIANKKYFGTELFEVLKFASNYFISSLGNTLFTALPPLYRNAIPKVSSLYLLRYKFNDRLEALLKEFLEVSEDLYSFIEANYLLTAEHIEELANLRDIASAVEYFKSVYNLISAKLLSKLEEQGFKEFKPRFKELELNLANLKIVLQILALDFTLEKLAKLYNLEDNSEQTLILDPVDYELVSEIIRSLAVVNHNTKSYKMLLDNGYLEVKQLVISCKLFNFLPYHQAQVKWFSAISYLSQEQKQSHLINLSNKLVLNEQQREAYNQVVNNSGYATYLLDGVTGSGKTEVYLQLIEYYLLQGKSCLVLVPEIGLTPQTVNRFKNRFNVKIHIIHSNIDDEAKNQIIAECQEGEVGVLIGTRSAIFTQMQNLGCIILDEEHDSSYKQQNDFRYNARDLAILRASKLNIPIIMGSATPSFTSLYNLELGKFQHLVLSRRASAKFENKTIILDIRTQEFVGINDKKALLNKAGITTSLWNLIIQELEKDNQILLFLNRRGFATQLVCDTCGYIFLCPECDRPLTYHRRRHELHCHYCGVRFSNLPESCPSCNSSMLVPLGIGTEQIEQICGQLYRADRVIRIDRDTSKNSQQLEENLLKAHNTQGSILIGTQMIAKGHHFANVTLVALLNIDGLMLSDDYRAAERLAQLYVQVAGRAGRENKPGTVVLQTGMPHEKIYHDLLTLSYFNFANIYMNIRKNLHYPPYTYQAYLAIRHLDQELAFNLIQEIMQLLRKTIHEFMVKLKRDIKFSLNLNDLGKQNRLHKYLVDFIVEDRNLRSEILQQVNQV
ncbi:replication restart helicase PriA, partial [Psittacicella gerlachiana]